MSGVNSTNQNVMISVSARDLTGNTFNRINAAMNGMVESARHVGVQMTVAGAGVKFATQPILKFFTDAVKLGTEYEAQVLRTLGAFSTELQTNAQQVEARTALVAEANRVGVQYALSNLEAAQALEVLGKTGRSVSEAIGDLEAVTQFAEANNYDLAKSAELVAVAMTIFGKEGVTATQIAGQLTAAQLNSAQSIEDIAVAFRHGAGAVASVNIPMEQYATGLGIAANNSIKGAMAGTQFRSMITRMIKPTAEAREVINELGINFFQAGEDAEAAVTPVFELEKQLNAMFGTMTKGEKQDTLLNLLSDLGIATTDLNGKTLTATDAQKVFLNAYRDLDFDNAEQVDSMAESMANYGIEMFDTKGKMKDLPELFAHMNEQMSHLTDTQKQAVLTTLFTQRGFQLVNALVNTSAEEWANMTGAVDDGEASLQRLIDIIQTGVGYSLEVLAGNLEVIATILFEVIRGPLQIFIEGLIAMSEAFVNSAPAVKTFVTAIVGFIAILGGVVAPIMLFIGLLATALGSIPVLLIFGAITGAVTLFIAAIAVITTRLEDFKKAIEPAVEALRFLNYTLNEGATGKEGQFFNNLARIFGDVVLGAVNRLAKGVKLLVDIFITFRQALNGEWVDHPEINRITAVFGTLGHIFRQLIGLAGSFIDALQRMWRAFQRVNAIFNLQDRLSKFRFGDGSELSGIQKIADELNTFLEGIERKIVAFQRRFDKEIAPGIEEFGRRAAVVFNTQIKPAIEGFVNTALVHLNRFANWFTGIGGPKIAEWAGRFAEWFVLKGLPGFINNLRGAFQLYVSIFTTLYNIFTAVLPYLISFVSFMARMATAFTDTAAGGWIVTNAMKAFLALRIGAYLLGILAPLGSLIAAFTLFTLAGPIKAVTGFIAAIGWMRGAFATADVAKDKHLKNQSKLQRVFAASVRATQEFARNFVRGLVLAFGQASIAVSTFLGHINTLFGRLRRTPTMRTPVWALPAPPTMPDFDIPDKTITITQKFLTIGTSLLEAISAAKNKTITTFQNFRRQGVYLLHGLSDGMKMTVTVTQKFEQIGAPVDPNIVDVEGGLSQDRTPVPGGNEIAKSAGKEAGETFLGAMSGAILASKGVTIRNALIAIMRVAGGKGLVGTGIAIAAALILAIVLAIQNPQYITQIGNAIARLLGESLPYAIGAMAGYFVNFAYLFSKALIDNIQTILETTFALSFPSIALALKMPDILEAMAPIQTFLTNLFLEAANLIMGPALTFAQSVWDSIGTALSTTWTTLIGVFNTIWGELVTTLTGTIPTFFMDIGSVILTAIAESIQLAWSTFIGTLNQIFIQLPQDIINILATTLGPPLVDFFTSLFALDFRGAWEAGIEILVAVFVTLPQRLMETFGTHWEAIRTRMETFWDGIGEIWSGAWEGLGGAWEGLTTSLGESWETIRGSLETAWDTISGAWTTAWEEIGTAWDGLVEGIKETGTTVWGEITSVWEGVKGTLVGIVQGIWEEIEPFFGRIERGFEAIVKPEAVEAIKRGWGEVTGAISGAGETIATFVSDAASGISGFATDSYTDISTFASDSKTEIETFASGAATSISTFVTDAITALGRLVTEGVQAVLNFVTGARTEFEIFVAAAYNYGVDVVQSLMNGMYSLFINVLAAANAIIGAIKAPFGDPLQLLKTIGENIIQGLIDGFNAMKETAKGALQAIVDELKAIPGVSFLTQSPSKFMHQIGQWVIEGLAIGITEEQATAAKAMSDAIGAVLDAAKSVEELGKLLRTATIFPIDTGKLQSLALQAADAYHIVGEAIASIGYDEDSEKAYKGRLDMVTGAIDALMSIFELMQAVAENEADITNLSATFGVLKLGLEKAIDELNLMFNYLGPEKLANASAGVTGAQEISESLLAMLELLIKMTEFGGYVNFEMFGTLKLALERAIDELNLMFLYLGPEKIANATAAIAVAKEIGEGFNAIIEMLAGLARLNSDILADINKLGELKLVLERAIHELALMFDYFSEGQIGKAGKAAAIAEDVGDGFEAIVKFLRLLNKNIALDFDASRIHQLVEVLKVSVQELGNAFVEVGQPFIDNAKVFATSGAEAAKALIETFKLISSAAKVGVTELPEGLIQNLVSVLVLMVNELSGALNDINYGLLEPAQQAAEAGAEIADALLSVFELIEALAKSDDVILLPLHIETLTDALVLIVTKFLKVIQEQFIGVDEETYGLIESFGNAAVGIIDAIGSLIETMTLSTEELELLVANLPQEAIIQSIAAFFSDLVLAFENIALQFDEDTLSLIESFAGAGGNLIDAFTKIPDALEAISKFKSPTDSRMMAIRDFFNKLVTEFRLLAQDLEKDALELTELFASVGGQILDALANIPDAMEGITKLRIPTEKHMRAIKDFFMAMTNMMLDLAHSFTDTELEDIEKYADTVGKALDILKKLTDEFSDTADKMKSSTSSAGRSMGSAASSASNVLRSYHEMTENIWTGMSRNEPGRGKYQIFGGGMMYREINGQNPYTKAIERAEEEIKRGVRSATDMRYKLIKWMEKQFASIDDLSADFLLEQLLWVGGGNFGSQAGQDAAMADWAANAGTAKRAAEKMMTRLELVANFLAENTEYWTDKKLWEALEERYQITRSAVVAYLKGAIAYIDEDSAVFGEVFKQWGLEGRLTMNPHIAAMIDPKNAAKQRAWAQAEMKAKQMWVGKMFEDFNYALSAQMQRYTKEQEKWWREEGKYLAFPWLAPLTERDLVDMTETNAALRKQVQKEYEQQHRMIERRQSSAGILSQMLGYMRREMTGHYQVMVDAFGTFNTQMDGLTSYSTGVFKNWSSELVRELARATHLSDQEFRKFLSMYRLFVKNVDGVGKLTVNPLQGTTVTAPTIYAGNTVMPQSNGTVVGTVNLGGITVQGTGNPQEDGTVAGQAAITAIYDALHARNT